MSRYILSHDPKQQMEALNLVVKELRKLAKKGRLVSMEIEVKKESVDINGIVREFCFGQTFTIKTT